MLLPRRASCRRTTCRRTSCRRTSCRRTSEPTSSADEPPAEPTEPANEPTEPTEPTELLLSRLSLLLSRLSCSSSRRAWSLIPMHQLHQRVPNRMLLPHLPALALMHLRPHRVHLIGRTSTASTNCGCRLLSIKPLCENPIR